MGHGGGLLVHCWRLLEGDRGRGRGRGDRQFQVVRSFWILGYGMRDHVLVSGRGFLQAAAGGTWYRYGEGVGEVSGKEVSVQWQGQSEDGELVGWRDSGLRWRRVMGFQDEWGSGSLLRCHACMFGCSVVPE